MITANQWYNIAQTAQVGTKSGIRIDFGTKYALFKVSVDYGNAVIAAVESNITAEETRLSVRIRYNNSAWFVDVRFSVSQETTLSAATYDNTGWEAVSPNTSVAGNTICIINDLTSLISPSGGGESLFELMNVGTAEVPRFAVVPKKYNGVEVGIISNTFISMAGFEEPDDDTPVASSSLGDLLDVQITDPKSKDVLTYDEDLRKWVNGPGGLDETALGNYLTTNKYITQDALIGALNGYVTNEIYNTAITAINLRLTELETAFKEWFYYDDANKAIRTKLSLIVDGTLSMGELGSGGGTEVASGKLAELLDVQITDPANGQILLYNEEKGLWVNGSAGLNEEQLEAYLKGKDYATNSALSSLQTSVNTLRTDFDNLNALLNGNVGGIIDTWNEVVSFLDGYSQSDDLATILSGMNSDIANRVLIEDFEKLEGSVTDISNRVKTFEDVIGIDSNGDVYIKGTRNFYTTGGTISMFGLGEGDSGEVASVSIKFEGSDDVYSAVGGIITLPAYPSGGGGVADSVAWSNVTDKPTTLGGYGITDALSVNGGFISSSGWRNQLNILRAEAGDSVIGFFNQNTDNYLGAIGFDNNSNLIVNVKNVGNANVLHSGNYSSYALPLSGGRIDGQFAIYNTGPWSGMIEYGNTNGYLGALGIRDITKQPTFYDGTSYYDLIHSGNITSQSVASADIISNSTYHYPDAILTNDITADVLFGEAAHRNKVFPAFFSNHPLFGGQWADVLHYTGYCKWGATQIASEYNAINPRVAIRKYNQARNGWGDWTEFITTANIGSQSVNYANSAGNADTLDGFHAVSYGSLNNTIPVIGGDGVMEIGAYLDLHHDNSTVNYDFSVRVSCPSVSGVNVMLPSTSGTIALLTDNVASATKLQTGRYLWGNYFNGESDVNGKPFFKTSTANASINVDIASIIVGPVTLNRSGYSSGVGFNGLLGYGGYDNHLHGWIGLNGWYSSAGAETYALVFAVNDNTTYGSVLTERMRITPNGNVLIGATTDWGFNLASIAICNDKISGYLGTGGGAFFGNIAEGFGTAIWTQGNGNGYIQQGRSNGNATNYNLIFQPLGGNVLIGTTTDNGSKLQVNGNVSLGYGKLVFGGSITNYHIGWDDDTNMFAYTNYYGHRFFSKRVERIRITGDGNVLIGTTNDNGNKLQVNGSITATEWLYGGDNCGMYITNTGVYYSNHAKYANIESAGNEICIGGNSGGSIYVNYRVPRHYNIAPTSWVWCAGSPDSRATFFIGELRSYGIQASGDLVVTGTIAMGTLSSSSDARLKDNIELLTEDESLAVLRQLRPSKWNWKSNGALSYGFIAQEVEGIASCMVDRMNDEELGQKLYLQYNQLHAFEVGAIQYIDSEVEQLKRDLNTANLRIEKLEKELKQYRICQ